MKRRANRLWIGLALELALATALAAALRPRSLSSWPPGGALAGAAAGTALFVLLARRVPRELRVRQGRLSMLAAKGAVLAVKAAAEELLWRGVVLSALAPVLGVAAAATVATLGFALSHRSSRGLPVHLATGAVFALLLVVTGSLLAPIAAHVVYNLLIALALELEPRVAPDAAGADQ